MHQQPSSCSLSKFNISKSKEMFSAREDVAPFTSDEVALGTVNSFRFLCTLIINADQGANHIKIKRERPLSVYKHVNGVAEKLSSARSAKFIWGL